MSSLNPSGMPEIIKESDARSFTNEIKLPLMTKPESQRPLRPRGSYPIFIAESGRIVIARLGNIDEQLALDLVPDGIPVNWTRPGSNPTLSFTAMFYVKSDLPEKALTARGADLRKYQLEAMGVDGTKYA